MSEVRKIDVVGLGLLITGLFCFLLGVAWGGQPLPWSSAKILGLLISGAVGIVAFVLWETYSGVPVPIVPMHLFRDIRGFDVLCVISALGGISYLGLAIIWPSQVNTIFTTPTTTWQQTAWKTTTTAFGASGGALVLIPLMTIVKHFRYQGLFFCAFNITFVSLLSTVTKATEARDLAYSFLASFPVGWFEVASGIMVQLIVEDIDLGAATSVIASFRMAFGSIFQAIFVAILQHKLKTEIPSHVIPAAVAAGLPETSLPALFKAIGAGFTPSSVSSVRGLTPSVLAAVTNGLSAGFSAAYSFVYYAALAFPAFAFIVVCFSRDYDALFNGHVARQVYKYNGGQGGMEDTSAEKTIETKDATVLA